MIAWTSQYPVQMSLLSAGYAKVNMCDVAVLYDRNYITITMTFENIACVLDVREW